MATSDPVTHEPVPSRGVHLAADAWSDPCANTVQGLDGRAALERCLQGYSVEGAGDAERMEFTRALNDVTLAADRRPRLHLEQLKDFASVFVLPLCRGTRCASEGDSV